MTTVTCETKQAGEYPLSVRVRTHELSADVGIESGSTDAAPGAHDYFDIALATCKAHTSIWYAKRKGIPLERVDVVVDSDASQERHGIYKMHVRLTFHGALTPAQRADLYRAAGACPVSKLMTTAEVQIETEPLAEATE